ncbi:MAG: glycosyltransferase [Melioribacteraceae bacterium]|nr:glycosyltransferase [Melioribacteraceae bacterium]
MDKIRVLFVTNLYPSKERPDFGVFTKDQIDLVLKSKEIEGDIIFIDIFKNGIEDYFNAFRQIRKTYKNYNLIHSFHGLTLIISFLATKRIPILISFLNSIENESLKNNKKINYLFSSIYKSIVTSRRVYKIFKDKIPVNKNLSKRSYYLPNGVNLADYYPIDRSEAIKTLDLDPSKNFILFVSSKDKKRQQKRYDIFHEVIRYLKENYSDLNVEELVMSGVPRNLSIYYYNSASAHLITSDWEGSPNSVKEALACNIPVVARNVGNISKMIDDLKGCFVTDSKDIAVLSELVYRAISFKRNINLRDELVKRNLDSESKTNELLNIYKDIYDRK